MRVRFVDNGALLAELLEKPDENEEFDSEAEESFRLRFDREEFLRILSFPFDGVRDDCFEAEDVLLSILLDEKEPLEETDEFFRLRFGREEEELRGRLEEDCRSLGRPRFFPCGFLAEVLLDSERDVSIDFGTEEGESPFPCKEERFFLILLLSSEEL